MKYSKYHGLGNDYIVIHPDDLREDLDTKCIQLICDRNFGIGSDGILLGPLWSDDCDFGLRIYNPDGSEAEKSGNGLRIFARYLWDLLLVEDRSFTVETLGGNVICHVQNEGKIVIVEMGEVNFLSSKIPVTGAERQVMQEQIVIDNTIFEYCAASIGNPHCTILCDVISPELAQRYGPLIETDARFPRRINVQFMKIIDRNNIQIEIWERGAGYTLASGSSSTASAAVAHKLGLCDSDITVHMQGGNLSIHLTSTYVATLSGPVTRVCEGVIAPEMFETCLPVSKLMSTPLESK